MLPLTESLKSSKARNKWLIVVTDDGKKTDEEVKKQVEKFKKLNSGVRVVFVLIEPDKELSSKSTDVISGYWKANANAEIIIAETSEEIPQKLEDLAKELMGLPPKGINKNLDDNKLNIESELPLTGVVVFIQDVKKPFSENEVSAKLGNVDVKDMRFNEIKSPKNEQSVDDLSYVIHLSSTQMISAQSKPAAQITFSNGFDTKKVKITVFPKVAKKIVTEVYKDDGDKAPLNNGEYAICEGTPAFVRTTLNDLANNVIPTGHNMTVKLQSSGKNYKSKTHTKSKYQYHEVEIPYKDFKQQSLKLTPNSTYKGYFENDRSQPVIIKSVPCQRAIALKLVSGAPTGDWRSDVDTLDTAEKVVLNVLIEGRVATEKEMEKLELMNLPSDFPWHVEKNSEKSQFILKPKSACCAFFWIRPNLIDQTTLTIKRENLSSSVHDKMPKPLNLTYEITRPDDDYRYYWWKYGCPIAFWGAVLLLFWYFVRLLSKERFAPKTYIHYQRRGMLREKHEPLVKSRRVLKRWLWPSKREIRTVEGVIFAAVGKRGNSVKIIGRCLDEYFDIDGYEFQEHLRDKGKPQPDIKLPRAVTFYHYDENGNHDLRMQFSHTHKAVGIEWEKPLV